MEKLVDLRLNNNIKKKFNNSNSKNLKRKLKKNDFFYLYLKNLKK